MKFPDAFTIAPRTPDYSLCARDVIVETKITFLINAEIQVAGRTKLTGWNKSASTRVRWVVSNPISEEDAKASVRGAIMEIAKTRNCMIEAAEAGEDHLLPLVTGVPLSCHLVSMKIISTPPPRRKRAFLWDYIGEVKDAFRAKLSEVRELVENHSPA